MIGDNIRKMMELKKITAKELAAKSGITATHLSYVINNKRTPSLELAETIADALHVSLSELVQPIVKENSDSRLETLCRTVKELPPEFQQEIEDTLEFMIERKRRAKVGDNQDHD